MNFDTARKGDRRAAAGLALGIALALTATTGCATKSYVRERVGELDTKMAGEHTMLRTDLSDAAARVEVVSRDSQRARELALGDLDFREADRYTVNFDFDSAELTSDARMTLDQASATIRSERKFLVDLYGYTCTIGDASYNDELSRRRATNVLRYLLEQSEVPLGRFAIVGLGESDPLEAGGAEDHPASRRVIVSLMEAIEPGEEPTISRAHSEEMPDFP
ncbi:MAG: OmpA family protein [Candidatus Eiseniibacteriota bacterium]